MSGMLYGIHKAYGEGEKVRGGGVVMIGLIPIVFGSDVSSLKVVMILAIVLMIITLTFMFLLLKL